MLLACALRSDCRMERELGHYLPTSYHPHTGPRASPLPPQTRPPLFPLLSCSDFFLRIVYASRDCADFIRGFMRTPPVPTLGPLLRPDPTQRISEENWRFHLLLIITVVYLSPIQFNNPFTAFYCNLNLCVQLFAECRCAICAQYDVPDKYFQPRTRTIIMLQKRSHKSSHPAFSLWRAICCLNQVFTNSVSARFVGCHRNFS